MIALLRGWTFSAASQANERRVWSFSCYLSEWVNTSDVLNPMFLLCKYPKGIILGLIFLLLT